MPVNIKVKDLWENLPSKGYIYVSIVLVVLPILVVIVSRNSLPPLVPLFYGNPVGEDQLTSTWGLLIAPGAATALTLFNMFLALAVSEIFLKKILVLSSFLISLLTAVTLFKIIFLVGFF